MKKVRKRKVSANPALDELLTDVEAAQAIFRTPEGKRVLAYLHKKVNARSTFVAGDVHAMCVREGMRVLYLHITWLVQMATEDVRKKFNTIKDQSIWEQTRDVNPDELVEGD